VNTELASTIRALFRAAMAIFVVTVVIGVLNGTDVVEFDHDTILTHVHAGTLGWITLAVFGAALWMYTEDRRLTDRDRAWASRLALFSAGAIALYVIAFFSGTGVFRPLAGTLTLFAIIEFFRWTLVQRHLVEMTVARLAMLAALASLGVGAVLGVLLGLQIAGVIDFLPSGIFGAHPATMVIGYLVLAGMAMAEWRVMPRQMLASQSRAGVAQVACMFLGGMTLMVGALLDIFPLIALNLPLEVAGVVIFIVRLRRARPRFSWTQAGSTRLFGLSVAFLVLNIGLIGYVIANYADDFESTPLWLIFALDHSMFIGVMTNALFALVYLASDERRALLPAADHIAFWGMNAGLVGFVVGLILQEPILKRLFTPVMGASILLVMAVYALRLHGTERAREVLAT
jgi:hypothetical protein